MARIRYTQSAEQDLLDAWWYIAEDNPAAADGTLDKIALACDALLHQPQIGRRRDELASGLRSWPTATPYVLYYFHDESGIIIARVLHHARDVPAFDDWSK